MTGKGFAPVGRPPPVNEHAWNGAGRWTRLDGLGAVDVTGRLIGGCIEEGEPSTVYLETAAEGVVTDSSSAVNHVALAFDGLRADAESRAVSRDPQLAFVAHAGQTFTQELKAFA